jgi:hypothetical protein
MGMLFSGQFNAVAVTVQQDFFELIAPADCIVVVHRVLITQHTEFGDAAEEAFSILLKRGVGTVTTGSGGTTPTPVKLETGFTAAGSTLKANNTTKMVVGTGTITTLHSDSWNIRVPFDFLPTPELRIILSPSERMTVELGTTPIDSITMNGTIYFEEIGG